MTKVSGRVSCCRAAAADQISDHRIHALIGWRDSISRLSRGSQATRETRDAQEGVNDQTKWRCGRESRRRCLCTRRRQSKDLLDTCTAFQGWRPVRLLLSLLILPSPSDARRPSPLVQTHRPLSCLLLLVDLRLPDPDCLILCPIDHRLRRQERARAGAGRSVNR